VVRYGLVAMVALAGCPDPRVGSPRATARPLASLVNETGQRATLDVLQSGARLRCDAIAPDEEAIVLAGIFDHPETGDRTAHLAIEPGSAVDLAEGTDCAAVRIGEWQALVHAKDRLALRHEGAVVGPHVHRAVAPPPKCAIEPLFFTPHMATLLDGPFRVDGITQGSCLAIDVSRGAEKDRWKLCAPPGSWPFAEGTTVKPYSHGTGLSFLGPSLNLVLEQPILPLTDQVDVAIHVSVERAGSPCIVPPTMDIAVPEGAIVVPGNLAIVIGAQPKNVLVPNTSIALKGSTQTHHYALQSAQHVLAVPSYFAREGLHDRAAWVYWTSK
jgi:hypothetical protein